MFAVRGGYSQGEEGWGVLYLPEVRNHLIALSIPTIIRVLLPVINVNISDSTD